MEKMFLIESLKWYPAATAELLKETTDAMERSRSKEMVLMPDPTSQDYYLGILLAENYTPAVSNFSSVIDKREEGPFMFLRLSRTSIRAYYVGMTRRMSLDVMGKSSPDPVIHDFAKDLAFADTLSAEFCSPNPSQPVPPYLRFLQTKTPAQVEQELNELVIGQPELTKAVADFLYYHALRQLHPDLPQRPLLIAGPSGSGKTEVWRAVQKLYRNTFSVRIIDGSNISSDGWAGNFKVGTYITKEFADGGILVVDEFDKLTRPKHSSHGDNVSMDIQAEFLKLIEGEYQIVENKKQTNVTSKNMGFVMVGAFEALRAWKERPVPKASNPIGFCSVKEESCAAVPFDNHFTDEDFIDYGIMPEIVGRIATKCFTVPLDERAYMDIIYSPHSRVAKIEKVLQQYGIRASDVVTPEELQKLVASSKSNKTGVRWVSAQVETRLLEAIREQGLFPAPAMAS